MNKRQRKKDIKRRLYNAYMQLPEYKALLIGSNFIMRVDGLSFERSCFFGDSICLERVITVSGSVSEVVYCEGGEPFGRRY